jgi:hypothetical protein
MLMNRRSPATLLVTAIAMVAAASGCKASAQSAQSAQSVSGSGKGATLSADALHDDNLHFLTNRKPVLKPGHECAAFTPRMKKVAGIRKGDDQPTTIWHGHGCWAGGDNWVSILTTKTPFGKFWRKSYPIDDGSGIDAVTVVNFNHHDPHLFKRSILDGRYYAVQVGNQDIAGIDSSRKRTACMMVVDTGSAQPLLLNLTQEVQKGSRSVRTVRQQCNLTAKVAQTVLNEQDPDGGSRVP